MRRERIKTQLRDLGHAAAAQIAQGCSVTDIAMERGCSRKRIYRALYAAYPQGDWPNRSHEPQIDPLLL